MAEVASDDADEAWKAFKLQLKSSKMATSAGAHMVAHKFLADQKASHQSDNTDGSGNQTIDLHDIAYLTERPPPLKQPSKTWARRLSVNTSGASAAVNQFAKRFAASNDDDDDNQSISSMPATSRSLSPTRRNRRFSLVDGIGGGSSKSQANRSVTPLRTISSRRVRPVTVGQNQQQRNVNLQRGSSEWETHNLGSRHQSNTTGSGSRIINLNDIACLTDWQPPLKQPSKPWARRLSFNAAGASAAVNQFAKRFAASDDDDDNQPASSIPATSRSLSTTRQCSDNLGSSKTAAARPHTIQARSKSVDGINSDDEIDLYSDGKPMIIRSYESIGIKVFSDNTGELLEGWGSKDELLEEFVPRNNRRASMDASPPRARVTTEVNRRSSLDEISRSSLANNRVPLAFSFKRKSSIAPSMSSGSTLGDHFDRQESNDSIQGGGGRSVVELFPKREKQDQQADDSYISGLVFFAPSREKSIRRIISRSEQDPDDDVSILNTATGI